MQVRFLGSGDAFSAGGRFQAAYLVQTDATTFLLDCGATILASMKHQQIDTATIDVILISHLHGDHFAGIPFLFLEYLYENPRRRPLRICGPPGTEERVNQLYAAMYRDLAGRPLSFPVSYTELLPRENVVLDGLQVEPFRVPHQQGEVSLGLRVGCGGKKILYSGDTGWTDELIAYAQGTDLFICECSYYETRLPMHLDDPRIWENRERFGTKRLILTHLGREVLTRATQVELELAEKGLVVEL